MQLTDLLHLTSDLQPTFKLLSPDQQPITKIKLGRQTCLLLTQTGPGLTIGKLQHLLRPSQNLDIEVLVQQQRESRNFFGLRVDMNQQAVILY
ncbi:MAG: hypothetical protein LKF01_00935 [Lactobacillus sp.]|jgi:hypothetical protein|nr:hypothetical protein [Lactobacillus sp.]MCH3906636.1 hypothetical protein [Lactobacillus sp.]MCH3989728.1 hypothetical protein [Lactobacillus sp.]MCH4068106.1 hypothetical protein [Lactobacillus sp.]MCI1304287.1 hypothetical protein [Lactobacillus sp.]